MIVRRQRNAAHLAAAALSLTVACKFEPRTPELRYSLNRPAVEKNLDLSADAGAQAQLEGALEFLFGTPKSPRFLALPTWLEGDFNPNFWGEDHVKADDAAWGRLMESNRQAYRTQIEAIRSVGTSQEDLRRVDKTRYADDLWAEWEELLRQVPIDPDAPVAEGRSWRSEAISSLEKAHIGVPDSLRTLERGTSKETVLASLAAPEWREWVDRAPIAPDAHFLTTDDGQEVSWREEALYRFENYYPSLANSSELYRQQCFHCHGAEGGGNGSTSAFLNPRPRDYRRGIFKFTPLKGKARPRHEDLFRILTDGIYTTAMPSFRRFTDAQLHGLVDYVRLLSVRGETEGLLVDDYSVDDGLHFGNVQENYEFVVDKWREAAEQLITYEGEIPEATPERIEHGRNLFTTPGEKGGANCVSCHGDAGRGDGASAFEIDPVTQQRRRVKDDWGNEISVRDLTGGLFRFGRRPIDLYRRIYAGINGTPMPEHFGMTITENGQQRPMTEDDIWDLVFFVRSLGARVPHGSGLSAGDAQGH